MYCIYTTEAKYAKWWGLCIKYFFKFLHNVTNKNIYFYKGSSGQNIILPDRNQMFSIFKAMSVLIKAVANLFFKG